MKLNDFCAFTLQLLVCIDVETKVEKARVVANAIEIAKSEAIVVDIDFFDFTIQLDILEFYFFNTSVNFIKELDIASFKYQVDNVLTTLAKCQRDFVYK